MIFADLNINTKKFLQNINLFVLVLFAVCLFACKDDPVTVNEVEFDPPRFNWRSYEVNYQGQGFSGLWAKDTNNIFLINYYDALLIKLSHGIQSGFNLGDYFISDIKGISENEVYIFGVKHYPDSRLTIIKFNGAGFEFYPTNIVITGTNGYWIKGCVFNNSEIWACSPNGIVKFDGASMTYYNYDDPLLIPMHFYVSPNNKLEYIYERFQSDSVLYTGYYEFIDTSFVKAFEIVGNPYILNTFTFLNEINGNKIGLRYNFSPKSLCVENFANNSFSTYFCYSNKITDAGTTEFGGFRGMGLQNFIFIATSSEYIYDPPSRMGILHWDGNKVSKEIGMAPYNSPNHFSTHILFCLNPVTYLIFEPHSFYNNGIPYLYIGAKK